MSGCDRKVGPFDCCSIICGDCTEAFDRIPSVDLTITDPPYGIGFRSNHRIVKHDRILGDDKGFPVETVKGLISRSTYGTYIFCRWDNFPELPKPKSVLAWVK